MPSIDRYSDSVCVCVGGEGLNDARGAAMIEVMLNSRSEIVLLCVCVFGIRAVAKETLNLSLSDIHFMKMSLLLTAYMLE